MRVFLAALLLGLVLVLNTVLAESDVEPAESTLEESSIARSSN
jgi:hypothetical protein